MIKMLIQRQADYRGFIVSNYTIQRKNVVRDAYESVKLLGGSEDFDYIFDASANNKALPNGGRSDFSDDLSLEEFETGEKCPLYMALNRTRSGAYITCYGYDVQFDCVD